MGLHDGPPLELASGRAAAAGSPVLQLTDRGARVSGDLASPTASFLGNSCVVLPSFLAPDLLRRVQSWLAATSFSVITHTTGNSEWTPLDVRAAQALRFLANDQTLRDAVRVIAGCGPLACFDGRVYRYQPGQNHGGNWHDDMMGGRAVAMSINLSETPYEGGVLELRRRGEDGLLAAVHNAGPGDAVLFAVSRLLEHRVVTVTGSQPKTSFAGWFFSAEGEGARRPDRAP